MTAGDGKKWKKKTHKGHNSKLNGKILQKFMTLSINYLKMWKSKESHFNIK